MAGNKEGAIKAQETMKKKYGEEGRIEFFRRIGSMGGRNGRGPGYKGGFAADRERARICGAIGGKKSRRTGVKNGFGKIHQKKA